VGSLGILVPPSIPMIMFCIFFTTSPIEVERLFLAGCGPAAVVSAVVGVYSMVVARRDGIVRHRFSGAELLLKLREGLWGLLMPVLVLGGMYSGVFNAIEASAVAAVYALVVEVWFERGLGWQDVPRVIAETALLLGSFIVVMVMAMALGEFLDVAGIPQASAEWITSRHLSQGQFLFALILLLLVVGCLMDIMSAIMIFAPLTGPVALALGIDPVHLGVIFILGLEVGYMTPPVGLNLFMACTMFDKSFGYLIRATLPFVIVMTACFVLVTYVPDLSLGLVRAVYGATQRGHEAPAEVEPPSRRGQPAREARDAGPPTKQESVQSLEEMMRELERQGPDAGAP
jgi:C4-dicarboxylate transporter DctM subunit